MATIDDVEQGICNVLASLLFPGVPYLAGGVAQCSAPWLGSTQASLIAPQVRLGIGEPASTEMEQDLAEAISNLAVVRIAGAVQNTTFLRPRYVQSSFGPPSLLVAASGNEVTLGGVAGPGMVAGVTTAGVSYAWRCGPADTPASVAAGFAAAIPGASANGVVVTCRDEIVSAAVVADQQVVWCTGQREALVQVVIIATPSTPGGTDGPLVRAAIGRLVYGLEALTRPDGSLTRFIGLPDGTMAQVIAVDEQDDDSPNRDDMWKRIITFRVMYDTGVAQTQFSALAPLVTVNANSARVFWAGNGFPVSGVLTDGLGNVLGDIAGDMLGSE